MQLPLSVSFRNMGHSERIESEIKKKVEKQEEITRDIIACKVVVELPHKNHQKGNQYLIRIGMTLPEKEIVVNREAKGNAEAEDFQATIRDAFDAARRQLLEYVDRRRNKVKTHEKRAADLETGTPIIEDESEEDPMRMVS